jgi:hypothetical protein
LLIAAQHSFLDAVDLNNEAVSMIAAGYGNNQKAIARLKRSVSIMRKTAVAVKQCSGQAYNTPLASSAAPITHHRHHHETVPLPHTMPDQKGWFMYNKALRFSAEIVSLASFLEDFHTFSAVVVFNLALSYHRSALCGNQKFASLSGKATSLYSLVLKLDWPNWISSRTSLATCTIVKLAATNNLAQISSESGDTKLAHDFLKHLSAGIRRSRKCFPGLFQSSGDMFELMISFFLGQPDTAVAPAA